MCAMQELSVGFSMLDIREGMVSYSASVKGSRESHVSMAGMCMLVYRDIVIVTT